MVLFRLWVGALILAHLCRPTAACDATYTPPSDQSPTDTGCRSCCGPCAQTPEKAVHCWKKEGPQSCRPCSTSPQSLGCYADPKKAGHNMAALRTLSMGVDWTGGKYGPSSGHPMNLAVLTYEICAKACGDAGGWGYFSVGDGQQCWCGSEINPLSEKVADAQCNMPCTGDTTKMCGGHWVSNVFELQCGTEACGAQAVSSNGWAIVISLALFGLTYVVGGLAVGRLRGMSSQPGLRGHVHWQRWVELHALAMDGVAYSRTLLQGGGVGGGTTHQRYKDVPVVKRQREQSVESQLASKMNRKRGREKREKNDKQERASDTLDFSPVCLGMREQPKAAAVIDAPAPVLGNAAGGGGRWVHVPG